MWSASVCRENVGGERWQRKLGAVIMEVPLMVWWA